jgi:spermidine synthase
MQVIADTHSDVRMRWLHVLFFFSGFPALLYQIVWQRALFTIYGVNIESVTVVVSAFMLGLGLGSLLGGIVSKIRRLPLLVIFGLVELATGVFGIFSLRMFRFVALFTADAPIWKTGLVCFALLVLPTAFMGSTLPILATYLVRITGNVGRSLGSLYSVNTLGSAIACFVAAGITMRHMGQSGSVNLAAVINCTIGIVVFAVYFLRQEPASAGSTEIVDGREKWREVTEEAGRYLPLPFAAVVSGVAGFIALAYEIIWYRAISYAFKDKAPTFAGLLGFYLGGVAFGSYISRAVCSHARSKDSKMRLQILAGFVVTANVLGFLVLPITSFLARLEMVLGLPLLFFSAALLGATFPLVSDLAVKPDSRAGGGISLLYLSNIVGSTLGSLLVGYILMDYWSTREIAVFLALAGVLLAAGILISSAPRLRTVGLTLAGSAAIALAIWGSARPLFDGLYERLEEKRHYVPGDRYKYTVETKSGTITVKMDDTMLGGGVYDGKFNIDLIHDRNGILRPFSMSLWHPAPRHVLMIGLSTGSWAQVIANHPQVEKLIIVEINPGYLKLIPKYGAVASLLQNPKVAIIIDDGRRWLVRNRDARFDVIVMNSSFHWRAQVTHVLSAEFLRLARDHLNPGGVFFYNTTDSKAVQRTGVTVFSYGLMVVNCLALSDSPIVPDIHRWEQIILDYRIDNLSVLPPGSLDSQHKLSELVSLFSSLEGTEQIRKRTAGLRIITDDNMATEW